jgi:hypothetical protein
MILAFLAGAGCSRRFFRKQADREVLGLLAEKDKDPRWKIEFLHVYPDPRSRFADWTNPDRPPMPPDDVAAKTLSPNPQKPGHKGVAYIEGTGYLQVLERWDQENRLLEAERRKKVKRLTVEEDPTKKKLIGPAGPIPPVIDALTTYELKNELARPVSQTGLLPETTPPEKKQPYLITLDQSVELALFNSREYQTAVEGLYLAALPVTEERFAFAAQGFALGQVIREQAGLKSQDGSKNTWAANATGGFTKLFSTGALLLVQFANQTVVNLGTLTNAQVRTISQSNVSLDIVQPFLRGGGRAVTLEPLTQSERNLLYAVRDYARFRQGFYTFIAVGQAAFIVGQGAGVTALPPGTVNDPNPFVPGAAPVTTGFIGPAPDIQVPPGTGGRLGVVPPFSANPQGFLGTLLQKAQLVIAVKNEYSFKYFLKLFQIWEQGNFINKLQVGQIDQRLLAAIENKLQQWVQYRQALDLFRIQLGLPTTLPVELDDGKVQWIYDVIGKYEDNSVAYGYAVNEVGKYDSFEETDKLRDRLRAVMAKSPLVDGLDFQTEAPARWDAWKELKPADIKTRLADLKSQRRKLLDHMIELEEKGLTLSAEEEKQLEKLNFDIDMGEFETLLRRYEAQPWLASKDKKQQRDRQALFFKNIEGSFDAILASAAKERLVKIRESWPPLPPIYVGDINLLSADDDTALNTVVQAAFENRLDLMNQQAQLVDSWRKIKVAANALMGTFNVEYHIDSLTPPGLATPLAFSPKRTRHDLVFNYQLPIVRLVERNDYRSALIAYQLQRRNYMDALDQVAFAVRFQLRNLRIAAYNFQRVQRRNMELAYFVLDSSLQQVIAPVPGGGGGLVSPPGPAPTAGDQAALTLQLINAQAALVGAQNDLFNQWLGYIQNRINLYRDMGLMPLDSRGLWDESVTYKSGAGHQNEEPAGEPRILPPIWPTRSLQQDQPLTVPTRYVDRDDQLVVPTRYVDQDDRLVVPIPYVDRNDQLVVPIRYVEPGSQTNAPH